ncbi:MAG: hypothetical protein KAT75_07690, partial [Dehalococcoidia bacterium]|nr:hypothetical protein [Dehalococcoidia bacterium]
MGELKDYSGGLISGSTDPQMLLRSFSKEALARLLSQVNRLYLRLSGDYENTITRRWGSDVSFECSVEAWDEHCPFNKKSICRTLNIEGNDVEAYFKYMQINPGLGLLYPMEWDLRSPNYGIMTVTRCISLEYFEKTGQDEYIRKCCGPEGFEWHGFNLAARL